jgi:hypothetical protein
MDSDPLLHSRQKKAHIRSEWLRKDFKSINVEMTNLSPNKEHPKNCDSDSTKETLEVKITPLGE